MTFCQAIDEMLGGGIAPGQITEFCGVPGIGKVRAYLMLLIGKDSVRDSTCSQCSNSSRVYRSRWPLYLYRHRLAILCDESNI